MFVVFNWFGFGVCGGVLGDLINVVFDFCGFVKVEFMCFIGVLLEVFGL